MKSKLQSAFVAVLIILVVFIHCYTFLKHPDISQKNPRTIRIDEDCSGCHDSQQRFSPVLPHSAEHDFFWNFYSSSSWWNETPVNQQAVAPIPETTGIRSFDNTSMPNNLPASPLPSIPNQSLSKSNASTPQTKDKSTDQRRKTDRRKQTRSESNEREETSRTRRNGS